MICGLCLISISLLSHFGDTKELLSNETETKMTSLSRYVINTYPKTGISVAPENVTVQMYIHINEVFGLDAKEVMELNGWIRCAWTDRRTSWNSALWANVSEIYLEADKLWTPDVGITNSKQKDSKNIAKVKDLKVHVHHTGEVTMYTYFISETPCPIETFLFPFDQQSCPLEIGTYYSTRLPISVEEVNFESFDDNTVGEWYPIDSKIEMKLQRNTFKKNFRRYFTQNSQVVAIILKRKPLYHIVLVLIPYCLTSVIANLLFILQPPNERLRVSLSVLLSMTVYVMIVSRQAPRSMRGPSLLGIFLLSQMLFLVVLTFAAVLGPLLVPQRRQKKDAEADGVEIEGRKSYRVLCFQFNGWSKTHDHICLVIHIIASSMNGLLYLFMIPMTQT